MKTRFKFPCRPFVVAFETIDNEMCLRLEHIPNVGDELRVTLEDGDTMRLVLFLVQHLVAECGPPPKHIIEKLFQSAEETGENRSGEIQRCA